MRTVEQYASLWTNEIINELNLQSDVFGDAVADSIFNFMGLKKGANLSKEEEEDHRKRWSAYMGRLATQDYFKDAKVPAGKREDGGFMALEPPVYSYYINAIYPKTDANPDVIDGMPNSEVLEQERDIYTLTPERQALLNRASSFFERNGPAIIMVLACRSLLKQYASANTSELLGRTRLLVDFAHRRIIETMQFVMDVMQPEWDKQEASILEGEFGIASLQTIKKLRITHAMIRTRVALGRQRFLDENEPIKSHPINQQEMIMANLTFSLEVIEGLRSLNIEVTEQEQNDFYQAWLYIGDLLGIKYPDGLKPQSYEEAWALQSKLYDFNFRPNKYGPKLAHSLLVWLEDILPMTDQQAILDIILEINEKEFDGSQGNNKKVLEEILQIDFDCESDSSKQGMLANLIRRLRTKSKTAKRTFFQELFHEMVNNLLGLQRGDKERRFSIIAGFEESWKLTPKAKYKPISQWAMLRKMLNATASVAWSRTLRFLRLKD